MIKCKLHNVDLTCDDCGKSDDVECTKCPYAQDINETELSVHLCVGCFYVRLEDAKKALQ